MSYPSSKSDGGAAFPTTGFTDEQMCGYDPASNRNVPIGGGSLGMSLRDYFAGQFLTSVHVYGEGVEAAAIATQCYRMADAMLAERAK